MKIRFAIVIIATLASHTYFGYQVEAADKTAPTETAAKETTPC